MYGFITINNFPSYVYFFKISTLKNLFMERKRNFNIKDYHKTAPDDT